MNAPWYRQLWPWLILSGPAAVLVAGAATIWIAFASADGLVAEDYYRQGMAINKVLAREEQAKRLGIAVQVKMERDAIRIQLEGARPDALFVHLVHATRAGHDQRLRLAPAGGGAYEAGLEPLPPGRWRIVIEDPRATWRIVKEAS
ncbi:MAG TPA: FixH family protein [Mizugakiibacter sp.]